MKTPFSKKLDSLLSVRGTAAKLADFSGVPASHLSKLCKGVLPTPEMLNKLLPFFNAEDADGLVVEYLLLHRPANARNVRILVSDNDPMRDRLERAIAYLDPQTRDALALIVEAVNRAPDKGSMALRSLGSLFGGAQPEAPRRLSLLPPDLALSSEDTNPPPVTEMRREVQYGETDLSDAKDSASKEALAAARAYEAAHLLPAPRPAAAEVPGSARTAPARGVRKKSGEDREGSREGNK